MPDARDIVINTSPIIALVAALGDLSVLQMYLLRAKNEGVPFSMQEAIARMQARGIWLSNRVTTFALTQAGETR